MAARRLQPSPIRFFDTSRPSLLRMASSIESIQILEAVPAFVGGGVGRDAHPLADEETEAERGLAGIGEARKAETLHARTCQVVT